MYKEDGQEFLYWAHLNNPSEIAPFMTRAAETIALQQKLGNFIYLFELQAIHIIIHSRI